MPGSVDRCVHLVVDTDVHLPADPGSSPLCLGDDRFSGLGWGRSAFLLSLLEGDRVGHRGGQAAD